MGKNIKELFVAKHKAEEIVDPVGTEEVATSVAPEKTQAECDLDILVQAQKIRLDPVRLMAAKSISGGRYIQ